MKHIKINRGLGKEIIKNTVIFFVEPNISRRTSLFSFVVNVIFQAASMKFEIYDGLINMYVIENSLYLFVISSSWHRCFTQTNKQS